MAAAKHTPGPWFTFANGNCVGGPVGLLGNPSGADTAGIAHCGMGLRTGTEARANARLIAAAPDLLDALQFVMTATGEQLSTAFEQAQDAIAKATGATL